MNFPFPPKLSLCSFFGVEVPGRSSDIFQGVTEGLFGTKVLRHKPREHFTGVVPF
jgi:hypothetical protein